MSGLDRFRPSKNIPDEAKRSIADWLMNGTFSFNGNAYSPIQTTWATGDSVEIAGNFAGYAEQAYKANGIVFGCAVARMTLFTEARLLWQQLREGRPGSLFGTADLALLETPWPGATTGDLLGRMEQDVTIYGNFYGAVRGTGAKKQIKRLRPDWVGVLVDSPSGDPYDIDAEVIGYVYWPGGKNVATRANTVLLDRSEVVHYAPKPDPMRQHVGMSWLTPVIREIQADAGATGFKDQFFKNAATPNLAVSLDKEIAYDDFVRFVEQFDLNHKGVENAYKTLYLAGGADVTVIGQNMEQIDFRAVQGAGETRICMAAEVPPIIAGSSEGLNASTYSNYGMARRKFADHWARPAWRGAAAALSTALPPRPGARLWYDDRDISFLQEDAKDDAEIQAREAATIRTLIDGGYIAETVVAAVTSNDWTLLKHSGLNSVQLQPPGTEFKKPNTPPALPAAS